MNAYARDQIAKLGVADRLRAAERARLVRDAKHVQAPQADSRPRRPWGFIVARRAVRVPTRVRPA